MVHRGALQRDVPEHLQLELPRLQHADLQVLDQGDVAVSRLRTVLERGGQQARAGCLARRNVAGDHRRRLWRVHREQRRHVLLRAHVVRRPSGRRLLGVGPVLRRGGGRLLLRKQFHVPLRAGQGVQGPRAEAAVLELQLRAVQRAVLRGQEHTAGEPAVGRDEPDAGVVLLDLVLVHGRRVQPRGEVQAQLPRRLPGDRAHVPRRRPGEPQVWPGLGNQRHQRRPGVRWRRAGQVRLPRAQPRALLQALLRHPGRESPGRGLD
mmetsp:Transcript_75060/g.207011  ORF Transcript_75060/g.207011 Transcript_75060/m.207011 type:complete len:264 (-) Transcript_75060:569-1360(-)